MVTHLVLYRPKPGLDASARRQFIESLTLAQREIPCIRRFVVGRRIVDGPSYTLGPFPDFPYVALVEFHDRAGLVHYLEHPMHASLGREFGEKVDAALVYDFDTVDASEVETLVLE